MLKMKSLIEKNSKLLNIYSITLLIMMVYSYKFSSYNVSIGQDISLDLERDTIYRWLCSAHGYPNDPSIGSATWLKVDYVMSNVSDLYVQLYLIEDGILLYSDSSNYVGETTGYLYLDALEIIHRHHHVHNGIVICSRYRYTIINN